MNILINSSIRKMERIGMRNVESLVQRGYWRGEERHAVSKLRGAVSMKIAVEYR